MCSATSCSVAWLLRPLRAPAFCLAWKPMQDIHDSAGSLLPPLRKKQNTFSMLSKTLRCSVTASPGELCCCVSPYADLLDFLSLSDSSRRPRRRPYKWSPRRPKRGPFLLVMLGCRVPSLSLLPRVPICVCNTIMLSRSPATRGCVACFRCYPGGTGPRIRQPAQIFFFRGASD